VVKTPDLISEKNKQKDQGQLGEGGKHTFRKKRSAKKENGSIKHIKTTNCHLTGRRPQLVEPFASRINFVFVCHMCPSEE
jgi:hypothetical protein